MFKFRLWLTVMLLPNLLIPPQVMANVPKKNTKKMVYQELIDLSETKMQRISHLIPMGNLEMVNDLQKDLTNETLDESIQKIEKANLQEIASFKRELIKTNEAELKEQTKELRGHLKALNEREVEKVAKRILSDPMYQDESMEYQSAYTLIEKRNILARALTKDMNFLRTVYNKKIGLFSKKQIIADLKRNQTIINQSSGQKGNVKKLLQISLMALAGVALVTWGISSAVYGARLNRIEDQRIQQLNDYKAELARQYDLYEQELTANEMQYLNDNGYVRMVCGTYQRPNSILCNRYDYQLFSGTRFCQVYCYRQVDTGKETLHESPVCTDPYIPADCYDPQEYWDAYARGDRDGYDDGYRDGTHDGDDDGYDDGRSDGANDGDNDGYNDGWDDGYDDGYDIGYSDGYADGANSSSKSLRMMPPMSADKAYMDGYRDGLEQYQLIFLNF